MRPDQLSSLPFYAAPDLDRKAERRIDPEWIEARLRDQKTQIIPVWSDQNLVCLNDGDPQAVIVTGGRAHDLLERSGAVTFLGLRQDTAVFTADLSTTEKTDVTDLIGQSQFVDLREVGSLMAPREAAILALARGMVYWQRRHRFCGSCGSPTQIAEAGHALICSNSSCAIKHFPRTDPAVIMLVTQPGADGGKALLGRSSRLPAGMYSTLAGFVEPGETLEQAVAREVAEESGVQVDRISYQGSQPWPFPTSLMIAFRAQARTTEINYNRQEMEDVRWFTKSELHQRTVRLPRPHSISYALISDWLAEEFNAKTDNE